MGSSGKHQLTVRGLSTELMEQLKLKAQHQNRSINSTVLELLQAASGLVEHKTVYTDLDDFLGGWSPQEADEFDSHLAAMRKIEDEPWQ